MSDLLDSLHGRAKSHSYTGLSDRMTQAPHGRMHVRTSPHGEGRGAPNPDSGIKLTIPSFLAKLD